MSDKAKIELTFHRSAASFILEAFPDMPRTCGICKGDIDADNLAGVVYQLGFLCNNTCCLVEYASNHGKPKGDSEDVDA